MQNKKEKYFREVTLTHPYFKTQSHFYNYINKLVSDKKIKHPFISNQINIKLLGWYMANYSLFIRHCIDVPIDKFTWEIRNYSEINQELPICDLLQKIIPELKGIHSKKLPVKECIALRELCPYLGDGFGIFSEIRAKNCYTPEFEEILINFDKKPGVYFLYDMNKDLIYIGKSYNVCNRVQSSTSERKAFYCKILKVESEADANVLEPYYISLMNPILNGDLRTLDRSSFRIKHNFRFTKLTKIFTT